MRGLCRDAAGTVVFTALAMTAVTCGCGGGANGGTAIPKVASAAPKAPTATPPPTSGLTVERTTDSSLTLGAPVTATATGTSTTSAFVYDGSTQIWQLVPDPWNLNSDAAGSIAIEYTGSGSIVTTVDLGGVTAGQGVTAFPFIWYGGDQYGDGPLLGQGLTFPVQLSSLYSLNVDVDYALTEIAAPGDLDIGFDEWLVPSNTYSAGPTGALEVMVLPYFNFSEPPAGRYVGAVTEPVTLNGMTASMEFEEYSTGTGAGNEVIFFPSGRQISSGEVQLNLLDFMRMGAATAGLSSSWYLAGIDCGSEFGDAAAPNYSVTYTKLAIEEDLYAQ